MKKYLLGIGLMSLGMVISSCNKAAEEDTGTTEQEDVQVAGIKIAYVEVDSIMTQYEFCKEYSLILEKKSQNIQSTLQQKGQALQSAAANFQQKLQQNAYTREQAEQIQANLQKQNADLEALQARLTAEFQNETAKFNEALHDGGACRRRKKRENSHLRRRIACPAQPHLPSGSHRTGGRGASKRSRKRCGAGAGRGHDTSRRGRGGPAQSALIVQSKENKMDARVNPGRPAFSQGCWCRCCLGRQKTGHTGIPAQSSAAY